MSSRGKGKGGAFAAGAAPASNAPTPPDPTVVEVLRDKLVDWQEWATSCAERITDVDPIAAQHRQFERGRASAFRTALNELDAAEAGVVTTPEPAGGGDPLPDLPSTAAAGLVEQRSGDQA